MLIRALVCLTGLACLTSCGSDDSSSDTNTTGTSTATTVGTTSTTGTGGSTSGTVTSSTEGSTTGAGGTAGTGMMDSSLPDDDSAAAITAFIQSGGFQQEGWVSVHDAPRDPEAGSTSPHGLVRVYLSPVLAEHKQQPDASVTVETPGAMAVKEFYDDAAGSPLGYATMLYALDHWVYHCYGPASRCNGQNSEVTADAPLYGQNSGDGGSSCFFCHGPNVYTELN